MTTKREKAKDYEFFLDSLKKQWCKWLRLPRPGCLVADSAGAITNGFTSSMNYAALNIFLLVVCYQHVRRSVDKHLNLATKEFKLDIKDDITMLQERQSKNLFDNAVTLFLEKWKEEKAFLNYFTKTWLSENWAWCSFWTMLRQILFATGHFGEEKTPADTFPFIRIPN